MGAENTDSWLKNWETGKRKTENKKEKEDFPRKRRGESKGGKNTSRHWKCSPSWFSSHIGYDLFCSWRCSSEINMALYPVSRPYFTCRSLSPSICFYPSRFGLDNSSNSCWTYLFLLLACFLGSEIQSRSSWKQSTSSGYLLNGFRVCWTYRYLYCNPPFPIYCVLLNCRDCCGHGNCSFVGEIFFLFAAFRLTVLLYWMEKMRFHWDCCCPLAICRYNEVNI